MLTCMSTDKLERVSRMVERLPLTSELTDETSVRSISLAMSTLPLVEEFYDACQHSDLLKHEFANRAEATKSVIREYAFRMAKGPVWHEEVESIAEVAYMFLFPICRPDILEKFRPYGKHHPLTILFLEVASFAHHYTEWNPVTASEKDWEEWMGNMGDNTPKKKLSPPF